MKPYKGLINILVDNESWILPFAEKLREDLVQLGYHAILAREAEQIVPGWLTLLLGCTTILKPEFLNLVEKNLVVHESNLPEGSGFAPLTWQILEGRKTVTFTLIEANHNVDTGHIALRSDIELSGFELCAEWREIQGQKTVEMCLEYITKHQHIEAIPQTGKRTYYRRRTPKDSQLDINKSIKEQFNLLRVVDNERYPAFFVLNGKKYKVKIYKDE